MGPAFLVLVGLGFRPLGELGIAERWAFKEPPGLAGTNTYVVVEGSLSLWNHLRFRDTQRADTGLRDRYGAVKKNAGATAASVEEYGQGKNAVVQQILAAAGLTADEHPDPVDALVPVKGLGLPWRRPELNGHQSGVTWGKRPGRRRATAQPSRPRR